MNNDTSASDYVKQISRMVSRDVPSESRYLALIQGYCDESHDGENEVYTLAGFIAHEDEWAKVSTAWRARCLVDGISCYHATDCAGQWNDFKGLSREVCVRLNTDLITLITESHLTGFAVSICHESFAEVTRGSVKAREVLGPSPYYLAMQILVILICHELRITIEHPTLVPFFFDRNEEVSGRAKELYYDVKDRNPNLEAYMGSLTYDERCRLTPLQVVDELAFESMKNAQAHKKNRIDRKPIKRMKEAGALAKHDYLGSQELQRIVADPRLIIESEV
jgi:hypothetical protein